MGKSKKANRIEEDNIIQINKKKCIGCTACAFTCAQETKMAILKEVDSGRKTVDTKSGGFGLLDVYIVDNVHLPVQQKRLM